MAPATITYHRTELFAETVSGPAKVIGGTILRFAHPDGGDLDVKVSDAEFEALAEAGWQQFDAAWIRLAPQHDDSLTMYSDAYPGAVRRA